jgi:hypothetical protein
LENYIDELYDDAGNWVQEAYSLGVRGDVDELLGGLGRSIAEEHQFATSFSAAAEDGWAWSPDSNQEYAEGRSAAEICVAGGTL